MNDMTLDEAIEHLDETLADINHFSCEACRNEHVQLREWLIDYRKLLKEKAQWEISKIDELSIKENLPIKDVNDMYHEASFDDRYIHLFMTFDGTTIDWLNQKFVIENNKQLYQAVRFMIEDYMNRKDDNNGV